MAGSGASLSRQAELMKQAGLSAGQYNNAMRQLPMQLTDVVTSLTSGMPAWQVAIQQGGQIRDSFGGIGTAARAVASSIPPAAAAFGGLAAAATALLVSYQQGQNEAHAYSKALILTGNAAGTSSDELSGMAQTIDEVAGTQRNAAQALTEVAGTGKFAADQIQGIATAAILMEQATGKAVSDTVKEFARLADEPAAASAKLNEQYHFLTASVYEQIVALEAQGNTTEAARLATEAYAEAIEQRTGDIQANLGTLEKAWISIKGAAAEAWDAMLNVGREDTLEQQLTEAYAAAERIRNRGRLSFDDEFQLAEQERRAEFLQRQIAQRSGDALGEGQAARINQASIDAQQEIARIRTQSLSKAEQKEREIANYRANLEKVRAQNPTSPLLDKDQISKDLAFIEEKYKEVGARQKAFQDDAATRVLMQLRQQEASLSAQLSGNDRLSAAQQAQVQFSQQIADLKEKRILTAEQKSLLANQGAIAAQLEKNVALDEELRKREQANQLEKLRIDILRASGQREAANEAQFELEFAQQRLEFERAGNAEALARLDTLKKIREIEAQQAVKRGTVEGVSVAPDAGGLDAAVGGVGGEAAKLNEQAEAIDQWRTAELAKQQAYLDAKAISEEVYAERVRNIHEQSQQELSELEVARQQLSLAQTEALFTGMADMARVFAGEQSSAYKILFAAQKAYSIASVLLSSGEAIGKAWASAPFPLNLGAVATTVAQTGALQALVSGVQLAGMAHDGIDSVPREGTWLLDKGERVVDSRTNEDLKTFLSGGQQSQPVAPVVNVVGNRDRAGQTETRQQDGRWVIDVFVADLLGDGRTQKAMSQKFALQGVGR